MINDYSFPRGASVHGAIQLPYYFLKSTASYFTRIYQLRSKFHYLEVLIVLRDVSGAFRHVPVHEDAVHMIGICLASGHASFSRQCVVRRHTCTEVSSANRRDNANFALRKVMLTVLGRTAIITKKLTPWSSTNKELGLVWNTVDGTVSIPLDMMDRALAQVDSVLSARKTSKADLAKLLGVFPHVATCFLSARAFYQRAHTAMINMNPFTRHPITDVVVENWRWFKAVLLHNERFNLVPVSQFADLASPTVHMYMDASNVWLWVLEPQTRELLRLWYTADALIALKDPDTNFNNVTDLQNAVLAAFVWGSHWLSDDRRNSTHVRLHIGNTSAVSWASRRLSHHPTVYLYYRLLSLIELQYE
ncbi:hypothetical protein PHMEG_00016588 [Phytophthora megakarya]|uniref:Uncharacterized protein n=1 Tax=Phytophthora megakarya TaxID=4795 RepID=A0A225W006_9STRA|nr:hypothetical protein PHMEG_00016588 [Phytophthora megakarya]